MTWTGTSRTAGSRSVAALVGGNLPGLGGSPASGDSRWIAALAAGHARVLRGFDASPRVARHPRTGARPA
jgi:hypothetical protein